MKNRILFSVLALVAVTLFAQGKQKDFVLQRFGSTGGAYFAGFVVP